MSPHEHVGPPLRLHVQYPFWQAAAGRLASWGSPYERPAPGCERELPRSRPVLPGRRSVVGLQPVRLSGHVPAASSPSAWTPPNCHTRGATTSQSNGAVSRQLSRASPRLEASAQVPGMQARGAPARAPLLLRRAFGRPCGVLIKHVYARTQEEGLAHMSVRELSRDAGWWLKDAPRLSGHARCHPWRHVRAAARTCTKKTTAEAEV